MSLHLLPRDWNTPPWNEIGIVNKYDQLIEYFLRCVASAISGCARADVIGKSHNLKDGQNWKARQTEDQHHINTKYMYICTEYSRLASRSLGCSSSGSAVTASTVNVKRIQSFHILQNVLCCRIPVQRANGWFSHEFRSFYQFTVACLCIWLCGRDTYLFQCGIPVFYRRMVCAAAPRIRCARRPVAPPRVNSAR